MEDNIPTLLNSATLREEFGHLRDSCYLDHTGASLYSKSQVEAISKDLLESLYSNPHSHSLPSKLTGDTVDQMRYRILQHFNTTINDYSVIFTSGATQALKIVADTFDFVGKTSEKQNSTGTNDSVSRGEFVYLQDNHTSVLGMRNVDNVTLNTVPVRCLPHVEAFQVFGSVPRSEGNHEVPNSPSLQGNCLFVYSAQCNFSGLKYPLSWVQKAQDGVLENDYNKTSRRRWFCLLDAATFVSTNPLDLSSVQPDFVAISFYKMFGLPTGLGALLVKNSSAFVLHKKYYGGGTVQVALSSQSMHVLRPVLHERFEDGTINFLSIIALRHGLNFLSQSGLRMDVVAHHCYSLARYTRTFLSSLHHSNGNPAVRVYADTLYDDPHTQGGIVNFNMCRDSGDFVGFVEVLTLANLHGIHLRTGCFCNPGACQRHLGITDQQYYENFEAGHVCGDDKDLINGRPTGSVRVSFGPYSTQEHADRLISMLTECFVTKPVIYKEREHRKDSKDLEKRIVSSEKLEVEKENDKKPVCKVSNNNGIDHPDGLEYRECRQTESVLNNVDSRFSSSLVLSQICLYPVKSCGAMKVDTWPLDHRGLLYDRCWMIVTEAGTVLTQKQEPRMCLIKPIVDLEEGVLRLTCNGASFGCLFGFASCSVPLDISPSHSRQSQAWLCHSKVCGDNVQAVDCGDLSAHWLCTVLDREGLRLIRQSETVQRSSKRRNQGGAASPLALSNQAQFLLINENSVNWLTEKLSEESDCPKTNMVDRFRSNFVFQGLCPAFEEQKWKNVRVGEVDFVVDGPCGRCQMICIDQSTGKRTKEPLTTLAASCKGSLKFGIYLTQRQSTAGSLVRVGDHIVPAIT